MKKNNRQRRRESLKRPVRIGCSDRGPDRRQVGNIATPSNERDRLSYLHCRASINSHGRYTHTRSTRVRIRRCMRKGGHGSTSGQPTHEPSIYLRPKRNSRIYFTYALLPPYLTLRVSKIYHGWCARTHPLSPQRTARELTLEVSRNFATQFHKSLMQIIRCISISELSSGGSS